MDYILTQKFFQALREPVIQLTKILDKKKLLKKVMSENPYLGQEEEPVWLYMFYVSGILQQKKGVTKLFNQINNHYKNKKETNKIIYKLLKLDYKIKNNMWSWWEIDEMNIDTPTDTIKFTNYEI
tara:strand:- start:2395 stop:2769 length:375 start_codon:yes stop_codon:yes gene_type:complete